MVNLKEREIASASKSPLEMFWLSWHPNLKGASIFFASKSSQLRS
jgi:hypothetical protein